MSGGRVGEAGGLEIREGYFFPVGEKLDNGVNVDSLYVRGLGWL